MTQKVRFLQATLLIAIWMVLGWILHLEVHLEANGYLLLGIPLCILFQVFVRRMPLSSCWVRDTTTIRFDWPLVVIAAVFMVVPILDLVSLWPKIHWAFRLYFFASLIGAVGVAFSLRHFKVTTAWCLLFCLCTAGVLGCAWMLLAAHAQHHNLTLTFGKIRFAIGQFLVLLPVCFVMEEVAFRGVLDSHIYHPQDSRPWLSAIVLSAMWGWWHLPITPSSALGVGLIAFPITHAMIGVPFSLFWRRSGNLIVPAAIHAVIDAVRNTYV